MEEALVIKFINELINRIAKLIIERKPNDNQKQ